MRNYIHKLQNKGEDSRRAILTGSLIVSMAFVSVIWVSSFKDKFNSETTANVANDIKPFALFSDSVSNAWNDMSASVGKISLFSSGDNQKQVNVVPVNSAQ